MEDAGVVALMRSQPVNPVDREDFEIQVSPGYKAPCRIYYSSTHSDRRPPNPGSPPVKPIAPKALPKTSPENLNAEQALARHTLEKQYRGSKTHYDTLLKTYHEDRAKWDVANQAYQAAIHHGEDSSSEEDASSEDHHARPDPFCIFTHGKSTTLDDPHVRSFCLGFARTAPILLFQDYRDEILRVQTFRSLANSFASVKAYSGRSLGARNAARATVFSTIKRVILVTFPLVRDLDIRHSDLLALSADTDVLFIIGDSDAMAPETHLKEIRQKMMARSWWIRLVGADHQFKLWEGKTIRDAILNIAGQMAAKWAVEETHNSQLTEMTIQWKKGDDGECATHWTPWYAPPPDPPRLAAEITLNISGGHLPSGARKFTFNLPSKL